MKLLTAKQHGAWAMLFIPFLLNMIIGKARWEHGLLLVSWVCIYLASYPFLMSLRGKDKHYYLKWFAGYALIAIVFLIYPIIVKPSILYYGLAFIPGFLVNMYFAKTKNERAFTNDIIAIINFSIGGLVSYLFGTGQLDTTAWVLFLYSFLFFTGTTFYVKTMIREKKSKTYKSLSWTYHSLLVIAFIVFGKYLIALAYTSSLVRAIVLYGKKLPIMKVGIIEIINALIFFTIIIIAWTLSSL